MQPDTPIGPNQRSLHGRSDEPALPEGHGMPAHGSGKF